MASALDILGSAFQSSVSAGWDSLLGAVGAAPDSAAKTVAGAVGGSATGTGTVFAEAPPTPTTEQAAKAAAKANELAPWVVPAAVGVGILMLVHAIKD